MKSIIDDIVAEIKRKGINIYSITEILDGETRTLRLKEDSRCRDVYSVSKAFAMSAIGFLFDEGKIKPESTVAEIFGELPEGSNEKWNEVTVHDILRHKTGLAECDVVIDIDIDNEKILEIAGNDWLRYLFSLPLNGIRGETYKYTDTVYYLVSCIVTKLSGKSLFEYLREKLFVPLGFKEYAWSTCPKGYSAGGSGLFVSCEDMAKLGKLWLDYGLHNGKRLLSEKWVRLATENDYAFSLREGKYKGYYKTGAKSQLLYFSYEQNLVIAVQSFVKGVDLFDLFP